MEHSLAFNELFAGSQKVPARRHWHFMAANVKLLSRRKKIPNGMDRQLCDGGTTESH